MFTAYILKSLKYGGYYFRNTEKLEDRIKAHNAGRVRSTNGRRPFRLWYKEQYTTKREALQREKFFKSPEGYRWLKERSII